MSVYVFGHKNPDSDSIVGAISLSYLKNQLEDEEYVPARQGEISAETKFILDKFGGILPQLKTSVANERVFIVDSTDKPHFQDDIDEATIIGIVDHHKLGDLTTNTPLEAWIRPIGCSNTVIYEMYRCYGVDIPKNIAGMMMMAILSDTVIFKSPTCTKVDTKAVKELFNMNGHKVGIGQLEMIDISVLRPREEELFEDMKKLKQENLILLTDIMKEGSKLLVVSDDESKIESAFNIKLDNHTVWLDKVLSRKKQIVPFVQPQF